MITVTYVGRLVNGIATGRPLDPSWTQLLLLDGKWKDDEGVYDAICRYLADAIEDCVKAKHDAIDAMLDFVTIWFKETEDQIGLRHLTQTFPDYLEVTAHIIAVQDKVARSREDRLLSRDGFYDDIEVDDCFQGIAFKKLQDASKDEKRLHVGR
jgi:hypothetical protein